MCHSNRKSTHIERLFSKNHRQYTKRVQSISINVVFHEQFFHRVFNLIFTKFNMQQPTKIFIAGGYSILAITQVTSNCFHFLLI